MRLSCAASSNFSRGDIGGSCVLELTAAKLGTTHNIRLVCLPWESSCFSCGDDSWSGFVELPLPDGEAEAELLDGVGFCWASSRALDWFTPGKRNSVRVEVGAS